MSSSSAGRARAFSASLCLVSSDMSYGYPEAKRTIHRGGGTRTPGLRFWRPPLYQLSYAPRQADSTVGSCSAGRSDSSSSPFPRGSCSSPSPPPATARGAGSSPSPPSRWPSGSARWPSPRSVTRGNDGRTPYSLAVSRPEDMQALWREYRAKHNPALRDRLIVTYAPLVKYVAGRLGSGLPAHVDDEDLVSYGLLGLIGAIERHGPDRDVKFETYAIARLTGAIIDELRAMDWVPRSVRSRAREIERAITALEAKSGRAPTDEEIAKKVGITVEELEDSLTDIARSSIAALDELWTVSGQGDQIALIDTIEDADAPDPQGSLSQTEMKEAIADAIARLPEREKLVVTLYYYEELTLREIGEVLGVTESRVSQLHTKAILRLKARLAG